MNDTDINEAIGGIGIHFRFSTSQKCRLKDDFMTKGVTLKCFVNKK